MSIRLSSRRRACCSRATKAGPEREGEEAVGAKLLVVLEAQLAGDDLVDAVEALEQERVEQVGRPELLKRAKQTVDLWRPGLSCDRHAPTQAPRLADAG
jgi:hypothetical protein